MEVKRCTRCGSFFASESSTCEICSGKDKADIQKIKSFFEENEKVSSINQLVEETNISEKNIIRLMETNGEIANNNILGNLDSRFGNISL